MPTTFFELCILFIYICALKVYICNYLALILEKGSSFFYS